MICSDECSLKLYNPNNKLRYWKNISGEYQLPMSVTKKEAKNYGGGSVMVWRCFSYCGKGKIKILDRNINSIKYQQILLQNLIDSVNAMGLDNFIFQQDNAPVHTSKFLKTFFKENDIELLPWPANSPDLNPIENIWVYISLELSKRNLK